MRILLGILIVFSGLLLGMQSVPKTEVAPLFASEEMLEVRLVTDFEELFDDRGEERSYHKANIYWRNPNGEEVGLPLKVMVRGNFRRKKENCRFPPIRLNFDKDSLEGTLFAGQNKLKLVTHCQVREVYEQYNLEEYLVYKMFNELSPYSFSVRLMRIQYEDEKGEEDPIIKYGFIIEDDDLMAERLGGRIQKVAGMNPRKLDPQQEVLLSMFAYMIGNTDWSIPNLHNVKLLERAPIDPYIAIPYDFDWCGLISVPYARPNPMLGIQSVKTRVYRGVCQQEGYYMQAVERFKEEKADIYQLFETLPGLEPKIRKKALKYLDGFYKIINDEKELRRNIISQCR